ncbi:hypothetical protein AAL_05098 [Moelleriella libera RCEF 2490]|uniref:Uncharacterized protein n=1 Tax=Moelleriella libera RCEF 2490 TaxID=1081109 RepID=A0A168B9D8_9HYPO|nr:hypothetical protein AAL_05098 [Moelleriella libera RCEF 2490]
MAGAESGIPAEWANHDGALAQAMPSSPPTRTVAKRVATPLGLRVDESAPNRRDSPKASRAGMSSMFAAAADAEPKPSNHPNPDSFINAVPSSRHSPGSPIRSRRIPGDAHAPAAANDWNPVGKMTKTTPPPQTPQVSASLPCDARPLRTASVRPDTRFAHPKPMAHPPVTTHSATDKLMRSSSAASNIAQLEATAERLSMTSSIDDAIRDLHGELKRTESRKSAQLVLASLASSPDANATSHSGLTSRHMSTAASIVSTNTAARHGGYSPAGFVMSPNTSLTSRLRSGSAHSAAPPDATLDMFPSRHGPGKASFSSVRSSKLSLAEISESEPVSLNKQAFEEADAAPPLEEQSAESLQLEAQAAPDTVQDMPGAEVHRQPQESHVGFQAGPIEFTSAPPEQYAQYALSAEQRPESVHSDNTSDQARDAFIDFDGVHWEPHDDEHFYVPTRSDLDNLTPRPVAASMARPKLFIDTSKGQEMLYYPARVPAMLNLPPKLSSKPKAAVRGDRRSQILGAMLNPNTSDVPRSPAKKRQSAFADFGLPSAGLEAPKTDSWLPDPIATHRNSFDALSSFGLLNDAEVKVEEGSQVPMPDTLRRPERLSKESKDKAKPTAHTLSKLPPQLRASAFFDLPSVAPRVEVKDGSAMATLDSILDASANAPVCAFTDHVFAGKLGPEVYGKQKEKKHRSGQSAATLHPAAAHPQPQKRSSMLRLGKRSSSFEVAEQARPHSSSAVTSNGAYEDSGLLAPGSMDDADHVPREEVDRDVDADEDADDVADETYQGPPTTLLAELQLRKQEQKHRVRNLGKGLPNGGYATLLEMDTVAEAQRKNRSTKRVNLAWEDADAHIDQNGSDDEEVPLAIIAAMQRGAKNLADLDRPPGLMERREMEDNEPLSHRRARLQGRELPAPAPAPALAHRQSMLSLSASRVLEDPILKPGIMTPNADSPAPEVEEIEEETLEGRRRRLASKEGELLPKARSVSVAFSAELLSQFGDLNESQGASEHPKAAQRETARPSPSGEEETLGQRRRRLQAEREARDREMGHGGPAGDDQGSPDQRRYSLANVLAAHPTRESDSRAHDERMRHMSDRRALHDRESKMAAMRMQMPTSLPHVGAQRSGGFRDGAYNDGTGGYGPKAALSSPSVNTFGLAAGKRSSMMSTYGMPMYAAPMGQPVYGGMNGLVAQAPMGPYNGVSSMSMYDGRPASQMYGAGAAGMMPMPMNGNRSMDRVEQWRYSVRP